MEELLERASKVASQAEVYHLRRWNQSVQFEANRVKGMEGRESSGAALRIVNNGNIGFSSTTNLAEANRLVDYALEVLPFGPKARLEFPSLQEFTPVEVYDPHTQSLPVEEMIELGQLLIDRVRAHNSELLCDAAVGRDVSTVTILNSRGGQASYTKSVFSLFVEGAIVKDTDMLFVGDGKSSCHPVLDVQEIEGSVGRQLEWSRRIAPAPVGQVPVIFTPHGVVGALLSPLLAGFNGRTVLQGTSPLVGKLGKQVLDTRFSMWDDATVPYAAGSRMCDDEGVPSRRLSLVEKGMVANFLYDLHTASQAGVESTACARRGLASMPTPGTSLIVVGEGDATFDEMVSEMGDGLIVERLLGAGQSNIMGGEFKANVLLGYRVQSGEVVGRVKNTLISGNVYSALKEVRGLERESHWVGGALKVPAISCGGVAVTTKD